MHDGEYSLSVSANPQGLAALRQWLEQSMSALCVTPDHSTDLLVAVNEVATNIVVHGYQGRPGTILARLRAVAGSLEVSLRDQAPPFDPTLVPSPPTDLPPPLCPPGGMGLHLARHFTHELRYRLTPDGANELTLVKHGMTAR
jgi:serine/threonine-protein kinase RsbW